MRAQERSEPRHAQAERPNGTDTCRVAPTERCTGPLSAPAYSSWTSAHGSGTMFRGLVLVFRFPLVWFIAFLSFSTAPLLCPRLPATLAGGLSEDGPSAACLRSLSLSGMEQEDRREASTTLSGRLPSARRIGTKSLHCALLEPRCLYRPQSIECIDPNRCVTSSILFPSQAVDTFCVVRVHAFINMLVRKKAIGILCANSKAVRGADIERKVSYTLDPSTKRPLQLPQPTCGSRCLVW